MQVIDYKKDIHTVGEVIDFLQKFHRDTPITFEENHTTYELPDFPCFDINLIGGGSEKPYIEFFYWREEEEASEEDDIEYLAFHKHLVRD